MPTRRHVLRCVAACGEAGLAGRAVPAQDAAGSAALPGPVLKGVARHEARFWEALPEKKVRCLLCPRQCEVADVERGACGVRENQGGRYQTLVYGSLCSANIDPIEKKPLFHYLPGTTAFSVATAGCNIECKFCQNWQISQFRPEQVPSNLVTPEQLVDACAARSCPTIAYTYSEPVIAAEYVLDSATRARRRNIGSVIISNGFVQEQTLRELCRVLSAVKIDLKAFTERFYGEQCEAELKPVLETLRTLKRVGIWFEIVVLIIPTLNDSPDEINRMSRWVLEELGPGVPVHFTRFHPTYRLTNLPPTPVETLQRCRDLAMKAGLHYVYAGNVPMHPGENTYCHQCRMELIRRVGYRVAANRIRDGACPSCKVPIPGVWSPEQALASRPAT
jgi:pyruvate formate lyase activating enzyme